jgi:hypothetical protein
LTFLTLFVVVDPFSRESYLELQKIKDLTESNGDVAFIDAVKHLYYPGTLDYLVV